MMATLAFIEFINEESEVAIDLGKFLTVVVGRGGDFQKAIRSSPFLTCAFQKVVLKQKLT